MTPISLARAKELLPFVKTWRSSKKYTPFANQLVSETSDRYGNCKRDSMLACCLDVYEVLLEAADEARERREETIAMCEQLRLELAEEQARLMLMRELLWQRHGHPISALYGDDGEMQCGICVVDFKRHDPTYIERAFGLHCRVAIDTAKEKP